MTPKDWALEMARYSKWQNVGVFDLCDALTDEERKRNRGMFFGSLHATLDHILMADMHLRTVSESEAPHLIAFNPAKKVYDDFDTLKSARVQFDDDLITFFESIGDDWINFTVT